MNRTLEVIAPPDAPTITTRRWFAAPPELVWEAWTNPDLLRRWMGPRTLECVSYDVDLRVGGGWRMVHRTPDGQELGFHGTYREIEKPRRLVGTFVFELMPQHEAVDTLTLQAKDGGTLATTFTVHGSIEARDGHLQGGMEEGMADGYSRLDDLLGERSLRITPFLWVAKDLEGAVQRYLSLFPGGTVVNESRPGGRLQSCTVEIAGQRVILFSAGPHEPFTDAFSWMVPCETQAQIDRLWEGLLAGGGEPQRCGWLKDPWGVRWQIVPNVLFSLLSDPDPGRAGRAMRAMLGMVKLDIAELVRAAEG